jgi:gluconate 5-dehydrogenase
MWSAQTGAVAAATLFRLDGRIALVTGASRGLGLEMAAILASAGATVLVNSREVAKAERIAAELTAAGLSAEALPFDPSDEPAIRSAMASVLERHGRLDILVANAAARMRRPLEDILPQDFRALIDTNLSAVYSLCWLAMPLLKAERSGKIILVSSISAGRAPPNDIAYATSKGGIEALMRALAVEAGRQGVTCNAISPGPFLTEVNQVMASEMAEATARKVPLGRFGQPHELAGTALYLASDASSFLNGHAIVVDGGLTAAL